MQCYRDFEGGRANRRALLLLEECYTSASFARLTRTSHERKGGEEEKKKKEERETSGGNTKKSVRGHGRKERKNGKSGRGVSGARAQARGSFLFTSSRRLLTASTLFYPSNGRSTPRSLAVADASASFS